MSEQKNQIVDFLTELRPDGGLHIAAIKPTGKAKPTGKVFAMPEQAEHAADYALEQNAQGKNVYYTANAVRVTKKTPYALSKPSKDDIQAVDVFYADVDPKGEGSYADRRKHLLNGTRERIEQAEPFALVDSGNGLQALWVLEKPLPVTPETEAKNKALGAQFSADTGTWNADRLLRLPGTTNYADQKKLNAGYPEETQAAVLRLDPEAVFSADDMVDLVPPEPKPEPTPTDYTPNDLAPFMSERAESKFHAALDNNDLLRRRWQGDTEGLNDDSRSGVDKSIGTIMRNAGFTYPEFVYLVQTHPPAHTALLDDPHNYRAYWRAYHDHAPEDPDAPAAAEDSLTQYQFKAEGIGLEATFGPEPPDPMPFVVERFLPATSFGIVGAGGAMKSTLCLYLMIHIVLGRPFAGLAINHPGTCVFVTSEDEIDIVRHRVRAMCEGLKLTANEQRTVAQRLVIEDTNGTIARLVEQDRNSNLVYTPLADQMLAVYAGQTVAMIAFDPAVYFGPGEQFVNDGPAMLMNYARRVSRTLGCATGFLHHTGQAVFRDAVVDQYAGRGGSAFADNARMVGVMANASEELVKRYTPPAEAQAMMASGEGSQMVMLSIEKLSHARVPPQPLWVVRETDSPWSLHLFWGEQLTEEEKNTAAAETQLARDVALFKQLVSFVNSAVENGEYLSRKAVRDECDLFESGKAVGRDRKAAIIEKAIKAGVLAMEDTPEDKKASNSQKNHVVLGEKVVRETVLGEGS